jgi:hypothetical protein
VRGRSYSCVTACHPSSCVCDKGAKAKLSSRKGYREGCASSASNSMWCLSFPAEVLGLRVFAFLHLVALVRIDSAVLERRYRANLEEAYAYYTSVNLATDYYTTCLMDSWQWCLYRKVTILALRVSRVFQEEIQLFTELLRELPDGGSLRWDCAADNLSTDETYSIMQHGGHLEKIRGLYLHGKTSDISMASVCRDMSNLRELELWS